MPKIKKKKNRVSKAKKNGAEEMDDVVRAPHSFVIHRGLPCPYIRDLTKDFRRVMEPFTAANLKEKKSNKIKDYVNLSGVFHVSHMCIFNKATTQLSFKVMRLPKGPTLTFKVHQFTLARDIINSTKQQFVDEELFHQPPLVIMNNFAGEGKHLKLMAKTFQNICPTINLATIKLTNIRRCLLFSYNSNTKLMEIRHYSISVAPLGVSSSLNKILDKKIPDLSSYNDLVDFIIPQKSDLNTELKDEEAMEVTLPQSLKSKGNLKNHQSAVRLHEIGPRLTCELIKVEEGLLTGEVIYHEIITKTEEEIEEMRKQQKKKKKLKEVRKEIQMQNKLKKTHFKKEHERYQNDVDVNNDSDNNADFYKQEVGEDPDEELFKNDYRDKRVRLPKHMFAKEAKAKERKFRNNSKVEKKRK